VRQRLFWLISRSAIFLYSKFPVFGRLRGAVAIIRRDGGFVAVDRNDGLGLCFPGGNAHPWETDEAAVRREVQEEAGMMLQNLCFKFRFESSVYYPVTTSVFEGECEGGSTGSWEGRVCVTTLDELEARIIPSQRPIVEYLKSR
jgi:8-oxo-dGTP pyrophosphatase MutT (NUDIX family)